MINIIIIFLHLKELEIVQNLESKLNIIDILKY